MDTGPPHLQYYVVFGEFKSIRLDTSSVILVVVVVPLTLPIVT